MDTVATSTNEGSALNEASIVEQYDEEVLCAGWIPQLSLILEIGGRLDGHVDLLPTQMLTDFEAFLKTIYEHQR